MSGGTKFNVICLADQWDMFRRRRRELMTYLAKKYSIENLIYVQFPIPLTTIIKYLLNKARKREEDICKDLFKKGIIYRQNNICIVTPISIVFFPSVKFLRNLTLFFQRRFQEIIIGHVIKKMKFTAPIVLFLGPPEFDPILIDSVPSSLTCYDLSDDYYEHYRYHHGKYGVWVAENHTQYLKKANIITSNTVVTIDNLKNLNKPIYYLPNAVEINFFKDGNKDLNIIRTDNHFPTILYVGILEPSSDYELFSNMAEIHPEWTIIIIGKVRENIKKVLNCLKNIKLLGEQSFDVVQKYIRDSTVAIIPYIPNHLNNCKDPLKLYQYLAAGKPIVTYDLSWAKRFKDVTKIARTREEFIRYVEESVNEDDSLLIKRRKHLAKQNSWEKRAEELEDILLHHLRK